MNALKASPAIMDELHKQLPQSAMIKLVDNKHPTITSFTVQDGREAFDAVLKKVNIQSILAQRSTDVVCSEGDKLVDVITKLSRRHGLFLTPSLDYEATDAVARFEGRDSVVIQLPMLASSIAFYGTLTVTLKNRAFEVPTGPLKVNLAEAMLSFALLSSVITLEGPAVQEGVLTESLRDAVAEKLEKLNLPLSLSSAQLATAEVLDDVHDGISRVIICKAPEGPTFAVRYNPLP